MDITNAISANTGPARSSSDQVTSMIIQRALDIVSKEDQLNAHSAAQCLLTGEGDIDVVWGVSTQASVRTLLLAAHMLMQHNKDTDHEEKLNVVAGSVKGVAEALYGDIGLTMRATREQVAQDIRDGFMKAPDQQGSAILTPVTMKGDDDG